MELRAARFILLIFCWSASAAYSDLNNLTFEELEELALLGDPAAQVELGLIHQFGERVPKDAQKALTWYCRAAYQGFAAAKRHLGRLFLRGDGVPRDAASAAHWFRQAAAQGDEYSRLMLAEFDNDLDTDKNVCAHVAHPKWLDKYCVKSHCGRIVQAVERLAPEFDLDTNLVLSVIAIESSFKFRICSGKNACGLMQLIPDTAKRFGVKDVGDWRQNLRGGMAYLQWLLAYFQGNLRYALAGYNAGEGSVVRYHGIPPYRETQRYVKKVINAYGRDRHAYTRNWVTPSRIMGASVASVASEKEINGVL